VLRITTKITFLAFAFLLIASGVEAKANSYLFRLTEEEINEVMNRYYPRGYDRDAVLKQMSEPFECQNFGDLCSEVGEDYAYRMVETAWTKARMGFPLEMINRAAEGQLEDFSLRWFERKYPLGVPDKDPYWGEETVRASSSNICTGIGFAQSGDFRVVHTSTRNNFGVVVWGRVKVMHFKRNLLGNWNLSTADRLEVEGDVYLKTSVPAFDPTVHAVSDSKYDAKSVAATFAFGGLIVAQVSFVEGCGGVPNSALQACSCSGIPPAFP
jgi:hypothetical protein